MFGTGKVNGTVYCLGEALLDVYGDEARVGGAPANVAACVAKLGGKSAFIGGISFDTGGKKIFDELSACGVDMRFAKRTASPTAIALVTLENGERKFEFSRQNTADLDLRPADVTNIPFKRGDILHFCSDCLMSDGARAAHDEAIKAARMGGALISYDVNLRPALWEGRENMLDLSRAYLAEADIIKLSDDEAYALAEGIKISADGIDPGNLPSLCRRASYIALTMGEKGSALVDLKSKGEPVCVKPALNKAPKDTTGAGDCFVGALLALAARNGLGSFCEMSYYMNFASVAAAISVSKKGAIASYPTREQVVNSPYFSSI